MGAKTDRANIVIVGGGIRRGVLREALERTLRYLNARVELLDRNNYFIFYPLLAEAGTGSLQPRHAVVGIRTFLRRTVFRMAEVIGVDTGKQEAAYRLSGTDLVRTVRYDHLVIALGSVTRLPPVKGLREYGFEIKSIPDAIGLRDRAIQMLELADAVEDPALRRALLHFVVVGANYTGAEVAGEFDVFLRRSSRDYPNLHPDDCRVTLVEMADRILPAWIRTSRSSPSSTCAAGGSTSACKAR